MNMLKKQGVAWFIAIVMIVIGVSIGTIRANVVVDHNPSYSDEILIDLGASCVYDDAGVLSAEEEATLAELNQKLFNACGVVVACVTTNYGQDDLYDFALNYAEDIGLGGFDFIVVLDISGDNYWLIQGSLLVDDFTDEDCGDYAWNYMEDDFARGDYGSALIALVEALLDWNLYFWG